MPIPCARVGESSNHPIFARVYGFLSRFDDRDFGPYRDELMTGVSGSVVEVGAGNGLNFSRFPPAVSAVTAVEPEPYLRRWAEDRARRAPVPVTVVAGRAESLPLPDASCDTAIACLVLCSVESQRAALAEIRRVLAPGGELRFIEHVRATGRRAQLQVSLDRIGAWPLIAGGCHCARDTVEAITAGGFELVRTREMRLGPAWMPTNPVVIGTARTQTPPDGGPRASSTSPVADL